MRFYQMISSLKTILGMGKITVSIDNQKYDVIMQINSGIYQDLGVRTSLLHAYCRDTFSFDTTRCCLLFYDWYIQKINKDKEK